MKAVLTPKQVEMRAPRLGSSEISSLFGQGFMTKAELWHLKRSGIDPYVPEKLVSEGSIFEPSIAELVGERTGLDVQKIQDPYWENPDISGLGATPEYNIFHPSYGLGHLEIKWLTPWDFGSSKSRFRLRMQILIQLTCAPPQYSFSCLAAYVQAKGLFMFPSADSGNDPFTPLRLKDHEETISLAYLAVEKFWRSIRSDSPPSLDANVDHLLIKRLHSDLLQDEPAEPAYILSVDLDECCRDYIEARDGEGTNKRAKKTLVDKIKLITGPYAKVKTDKFKVSYTKTPIGRCRHCGKEVRKGSAKMNVREI